MSGWWVQWMTAWSHLRVMLYAKRIYCAYALWAQSSKRSWTWTSITQNLWRFFFSLLFLLRLRFSNNSYNAAKPQNLGKGGGVCVCLPQTDLILGYNMQNSIGSSRGNFFNISFALPASFAYLPMDIVILCGPASIAEMGIYRRLYANTYNRYILIYIYISRAGV